MVTIDVKTTMIYLLLLAAIVLAGYLIIIAKNLVTTIKELNKILEDTAVVTRVAAERSVEVDGMIDDIQGAVADVSQAVRGEVGSIGAVVNMVKAGASLKEFFKADKAKVRRNRKNINKV